MRFAIVAAVLALAACSSAPDQTGFVDLMYGEGVSKMTMPDGRAGWLVNCDNRGIEQCYARSRDICKGANFEVVNRIDRQGSVEDQLRIEMVCTT